MDRQEKQELIRASLRMRKMSYSPYSHYCVGAALLCEDGTVFTGCNIENAAYGPSNCAERTAFFKAVSEGRKRFTAIAVCGGLRGEDPEDCTPCGVCRQVMREFCDPEEFLILCARSETEWKEYLLEDLLPESFGPENLAR